LKPDAVLFDITSIKRDPIKQMLASAPQGVELVSVHPLFGPGMPDMEGQTVIVTPVRGERGSQFLADLFESAGARVEELSADEHDRLMSVIQGLMSPVYEILIDFVGRILGQSPALYASIQMSADRSVHEAFLAQCTTLVDIINARDRDAFIAIMRRAAKHFGDAEPALKRSNKLIMANIKELEEFKRSIGSTRGLRNVYTGAVHVGIIKGASSDEIAVEEGSKEVILKTENVQLMTEEELKQYRLARGQRVTAVNVIDHYAPRASYTFRVSTYRDGDVGQLHRDVTELLIGIGCRLR
jgi:prephenate dehydrogenase